ncbi:glycosyltransferase family 8 protein [Synechococcus elongatus]|uniref:Glycosyltransferase family 8 protein n=1 Tax=Synechococcus elongatus PCC 11802 TaxID=2283154 RepID=A0AAT9JQD6_SYNEL|nr:glycosyltransferase family 8 protein [Synechococcus elongatus]QFZ92734.1 glycosyltransferase family 8 protein [Synechococcus elongatus PCC 11802]
MASSLHQQAIVFCCDQNYAPHLVTALTSLLLNTTRRDFDILILTEGFQPNTISCLNRVTKIFAAPIRLIQTPPINQLLPVNSIILRPHITTATLIRLFLDDLIDSHYQKLVYCDCDLVFENDVDELFSEDLAGHSLGAIPDVVFMDFTHPRLMFTDHYSYFNAGVLLIDFMLWKKNKIKEKMLDILQVTSPENILFADQDILNLVFSQQEYQPLNSRFNYQTLVRLGDILEPKECCFSPVIRHFAGEVKPWHEWCPQPVQNIYSKYRNIAPWDENLILEKPKNFNQLVVGFEILKRSGQFDLATQYSEQIIRVLNRKK